VHCDAAAGLAPCADAPAALAVAPISPAQQTMLVNPRRKVSQLLALIRTPSPRC
jgi:hypothetical protein